MFKDSSFSLESCHVCKAKELLLYPEMALLSRAASDCRPWPTAGKLGICLNCTAVQKVIDEEWKKETERIYSEYSLYHQSSEGTEQPVFDQESGGAKPRSIKILETLKEELINFPLQGKMIDIGCGSGAFLRAFSTTFKTGWELYGFEPHVKSLEKLMQIKGIKNIFSIGIEKISENFDLISIMHVLEHVIDPISFLKIIKTKLRKDGVILIQVPYFPDNPFDLIIADHCTHFTCQSLSSIVKAAGLEVSFLSTNVITKEITLITRLSQDTVPLKKEDKDINELVEAVRYCLNWLQRVSVHADKIASSTEKFGIFGTSISANWLLGILKEKIHFFVDEDKSRISSLYHDRPVYYPSEISVNSHVFMPLPRHLAELIAKRYSNTNVHFYLPPEFKWESRKKF